MEAVLDDEQIEEVFGGTGHSRATRASRVTAAKLQRAQLEEATAQVEELRRQVSSLTEGGEDSYKFASHRGPTTGMCEVVRSECYAGRLNWLPAGPRT